MIVKVGGVIDYHPHASLTLSSVSGQDDSSFAEFFRRKKGGEKVKSPSKLGRTCLLFKSVETIIYQQSIFFLFGCILR